MLTCKNSPLQKEAVKAPSLPGYVSTGRLSHFSPEILFENFKRAVKQLPFKTQVTTECCGDSRRPPDPNLEPHDFLMHLQNVLKTCFAFVIIE